MRFDQSLPKSLRTLFVFAAFALCFGCVQFQVVPIEELEGSGGAPSEDSAVQPAEGGNAAQEFCLENGGQIVSRQDNSGTYNACALADGSECELWALYDGDCGDSADTHQEDDSHDEDNGFEVDMGEGSEDDHNDGAIDGDMESDMEMVDSADWDIVQDMFFAGEVVGVSVESDDSLTITLVDESVLQAFPPDAQSLDDVLDVCGATCDAIFIAEQ